MVAATHARILRRRHMARDAAIACTIRLVMGVGGSVLHSFGVARQACGVRIALCKTVASAGSVTGYAVQLAALRAGTHHPRRKGIVLAQVSSVRIEVRTFVRDEIEVIEKPVSCVEADDGGDLGMAGCAGIASLLRR